MSLFRSQPHGNEDGGRLQPLSHACGCESSISCSGQVWSRCRLGAATGPSTFLGHQHPKMPHVAKPLAGLYTVGEGGSCPPTQTTYRPRSFPKLCLVPYHEGSPCSKVPSSSATKGLIHHPDHIHRQRWHWQVSPQLSPSRGSGGGLYLAGEAKHLWASTGQCH